jgi:uncharacterized protein with HEPN domain
MSPSEERDRATVSDLIKACENIVAFTRDVEEAVFYSTPLVHNATTWQIAILGEAVKRLSDELRDRYGGVPWQDIAGMRDRLIHAYDDIDFMEVWRTARYDVPALLDQLRQIQTDLAA